MNEVETLTVMQKVEQFLKSIMQDWQAWAWGLGIILVAILVALAIHFLVFFILKRIIRRTKTVADNILIRRLRVPSMLFLPLIAIQLVLPQVGLPEDALKFCKHMNSIALIISVAWLLIATTGAIEGIVLEKYRIDVRDNRQARHMHTQFRLLRRTLMIAIFIIGVASILMTFPMIRQLGTSLLASAGIAGLVLGLAARPTIENMVAGLQIAFTKPITLDDVVVIQGEWGRIEEITATYVVVRIWDQRRLIVPFSWILQQPFQNWTRVNADILGSVYIHADYTVSVPAIREELERIVKHSDKWDQRVCVLQVTDAKADTLEMRALVSASDSPTAWDLRCEVREKLIQFLQEHYPNCLPRVRAEIHDIKNKEIPIAST